MAVAIPEKYKGVGEGLIIYVEEFHGTKVNIRKTYTSKGEDFVGKGLCVSIEDWEDIVSSIDDLEEYVTERIKELESEEL